MAGHRRRRGLPLQAQTRAAKRRLSLAQRLAEATSPQDRVAAAADFLRAALKHGSPADAARVAVLVVPQLIQAAESLLKPSKGVRS